MPEYLVPLGRTVGVRRQRLGLQPRRLPGRRRQAAPRAARLRPRRRPRPRAAGARWSAPTPAPTATRPWSATFHAYSTKPLPNRRRRRLRRAPQVQPAPRADRRLRGRRLDRAALVRRRLHGDPERRRHRRAARPGPKPASDELAAPVRRPARGAQGPAGAARRVRGAGRARARAADGGRRRAPTSVRATSPTRRPASASTRSAGSPTSELWRRLHEADLLCAPSLAGESFGMVLTEAFAAGHPGGRLEHRRLRRRRHRRRRRRPRPARRPAAARRGAAGAEPRLGAPRARWARRRASRPSATPGRAVAERVEGVYERVASEPAPEPPGALERVCPPHRPRPDRRLGAGAGAAPAVARPRAGRPAGAPSRRAPGRRSASPASLGVGAHLDRRAADRRRQRRREHRPLRRDLGAGRDRR